MVWQVIWIFILAAANKIYFIDLWPLMIGSVGLTLPASIEYARERKLLTLFVVGRAIAMFLLTCILYRFVFVAFALRYI
jgi:hypothetical protein